MYIIHIYIYIYVYVCIDTIHFDSITMKCNTALLPQCSLISGHTVSENRDFHDGTHKDAAQEQRQSRLDATNAQIDINRLINFDELKI